MATRPAPPEPVPDLDWADVTPAAAAAASVERPAPEAARRPAAGVDRAVRRGKAVAAAVAVAGMIGGGFAVAHESRGGPAMTFAGPGTASAAAAPQDCLRAWNASGNPATAQLAALPQGSLVLVARVRPLPGTLMRGRPCAVTVAAAGTGARGAWVDGVDGRADFVDVGGYPAADRYAAPTTERDANAAVGAGGTLTAR